MTVTTQADQRDAAVFEQWVRAYTPGVRKMARDLLKGYSTTLLTVEDLTQQGLMGAWDSYGTWPDDDNGKMATWLFKGARWAMMNSLRHHSMQKRQAEFSDVSVHAAEDEGMPIVAIAEELGYSQVDDRMVVDAHRAELILALAEVLTPMQQKWVTMHFWDGKSAAEIKAETGIAQSYWAQKDKGIKAKLAKRLAHLREDV